MQFMPHVVCRYKSWDLFGVILHLMRGFALFILLLFLIQSGVMTIVLCAWLPKSSLSNTVIQLQIYFTIRF